ncbi:Domain of unknown function DUF1508 [uncultured Caudovirales phage]|uniref:DUF1508 domain-containing protein n=1 Tax=uncultured Caudovirales phage TaxID=2100421 RepID=A0A6J5NVL3_9CAUD|nr:Domain of unknown function DUF1508 [uncultured Caudovirales phage]
MTLAYTHRMEVFCDSAGKWRWRLRSTSNNKITATSGECFARKGNAARAAESISLALIEPVDRNALKETHNV